nr:hypothetical protein [Pseudomonas juntendi]
MQKAPSGVVPLPAWLNRPVKKLYNTRSGGQYRPDDVALAFALSLRVHDSADTCAGWPGAWSIRSAWSTSQT